MYMWLNVVRKAAGKFVANIDDIRPQYRTAESAFIGEMASRQACLGQ